MITKKEKLEMYAKIRQNPELALLSVFEDLSNLVDKVNKLSHELEEKEEQFIPQKGIDYFDGNDGENGKDGKDADEEYIIQEVLKKIPKPKDGRDGRDVDENKITKSIILKVLAETKKIDNDIDIDVIVNKVCEMIKIPKDGVDGSPDTGEDIVNKINSLATIPNLQIDASHIKNLPVKFESRKPRLGRGTGSHIYYYDLTAQCNGILKQFQLPVIAERVLGVFGTQFPINLRPGIDWTYSKPTLTLTSEVSAPESNQTLWVMYSDQ